MNEVATKENIKIGNMIYEIRGKQVMLDSDIGILRSQIATSSSHGGRRYNIRVFTEQGVACSLQY